MVGGLVPKGTSEPTRRPGTNCSPITIQEPSRYPHRPSSPKTAQAQAWEVGRGVAEAGCGVSVLRAGWGTPV